MAVAAGADPNPPFDTTLADGKLTRYVPGDCAQRRVRCVAGICKWQERSFSRFSQFGSKRSRQIIHIQQQWWTLDGTVKTHPAPLAVLRGER